MTTSYSVSRDTIITAALRKLQVIELGVTPDATTVTNAAQSLNILIKAWQTQGIKLWTVVEDTLTLVANQTSYTIGPSGPDLITDKPLKVIQAWLRNISVTPQIDTPLLELSKAEYNQLGSKFSLGVVNSWFYDPGTTSGVLKVFNTPDTNTATIYQLHFVAQRPLQDINLSTDIPDFPNEWMQALIWGLADELSVEYGVHVNLRQEIAAKAEKYRRELEDWDVEHASTYFMPDMRTSFK
jgi:hypothetical protein